MITVHSQVYGTSDNKLFVSRTEAEAHQLKLDNEAKAAVFAKLEIARKSKFIHDGVLKLAKASEGEYQAFEKRSDAISIDRHNQIRHAQRAVTGLVAGYWNELQILKHLL